MRILGTLKATLVSVLFSVAACTGDDAAMRQAKQQCQARDLAPASAAYDACVHQISEEIYVSWGRDIQFMGATKGGAGGTEAPRRACCRRTPFAELRGQYT